MPSVSNIQIGVQTGTDNTYYATWDYNDYVPPANSGGGGGGGGIGVGSLVSIKPGATYYNGVHIPTWVMQDQWYVYQLKGTRAVINRNRSGTNSIMSPIHINNLNKVG